MNKINTERAALLKKLKQRLEDSWSGFTQVIEEAEEFLEDIKEANYIGLYRLFYYWKDITIVFLARKEA